MRIWFTMASLLAFTVASDFTVAAGVAERAPAEGDNAGRSQSRQLAERMVDAWKTLCSRYYHPGTSQFFTNQPSRLPSPEKIKRLDPNDCGYGTGMDDVPLFAGILLVALCDQYKVTHSGSLKADALSVFKGLKLCTTAHGVPGFVARGVSPVDGKSIYITSSRDQYTHLAHAFWHYYHSGLCDEGDKQAIRDHSASRRRSHDP